MSEPIYPNRAKTLRDRLLALHVPPNRPVQFDLGGEPITVWLRTPLLKDREEVTRFAQEMSPKVAEGKTFRQATIEEVTTDRMLAAAIITLAVDEIGEPVFTRADFDILRESPIGGTLEKLGLDLVKTLAPPAAKDQDPKA